MYAFTDEQLQLRETLRRFLSDTVSTRRIRELMDDPIGFDRDDYNQLVAELGLGGVHIPEAYGGAGLRYVELCITLEEMGRALLPSPYFSSNVLAANAILLAGSSDQKTELLPLLATGEQIATVALYDESNASDSVKTSQAVIDGSFTGVKSFVTDGMAADMLILTANDGNNQQNETKFWLARGDDAGITRTPLTSIDSTRRIAKVEFDDVAVKPLDGTSDSGVCQRFCDLAMVALANEMVGGAQWLLESSVEYANNRVQFGRAISSMQAIKHKCADLLLEIELAKSGSYRAAQAVAEDEEALPAYARIAKAAANDAYMLAATDAIQIHGGIGFTWDNDTHLWFKRAKSSQVWFGASEQHRDQLLDHVHLLEAV